MKFQRTRLIFFHVHGFYNLEKLKYHDKLLCFGLSQTRDIDQINGEKLPINFVDRENNSDPISLSCLLPRIDERHRLDIFYIKHSFRGTSMKLFTPNDQQKHRLIILLNTRERFALQTFAKIIDKDFNMRRCLSAKNNDVITLRFEARHA